VKVDLTGVAENLRVDEQDIHDDGTISLPYINTVQAAGLSSSDLERIIHDKYVPAYFTHITVTVTPMARFFFVGGQVTHPDRFLYSGPITLSGAIQAAADFNPFADKKHVQITRGNGTIQIVNCVKAIQHPELDVPIYPGDRIWVGRRQF
jgi:protein involved in polysaccharide export with SLBB domain